MADFPQNDEADALALCSDIARLHARVSFAFDDLLGRLHGISYAEFRLLDELARAPDERLDRGALAARLWLGAAGVTRALLPLEKIGLAVREADGARLAARTSVEHQVRAKGGDGVPAVPPTSAQRQVRAEAADGARVVRLTSAGRQVCAEAAMSARGAAARALRADAAWVDAARQALAAVAVRHD